ncbi:MAG: hypothetical protein ACRD8W_27990 [Nitrososphaeraceae archaeon]
MPHKLIHVQDIRELGGGDASNVELEILGIVFDDQDIPIIEMMLKRYGQVTLTRERIRYLTRHTILSGLIVAGIVSVALLAHNINEEFYSEVFEYNNTGLILKTAFIISTSAAAGFFLEILITYRENRLPQH